jgi:hypothetical protein
MEYIIAFIATIDPTILLGIKVSLSFIIGDTILGILKSAYDKEFNFSLLPKFLVNNVFPYIGCLLMLGLFAVINGGATIDNIFYDLYLASVGAISIKFGKEAWTEKIMGLFETITAKAAIKAIKETE